MVLIVVSSPHQGIYYSATAVYFLKREVFSSEESKERTGMSNNNNQINIPQAKEAMNRFKMRSAPTVLQRSSPGKPATEEADSQEGFSQNMKFSRNVRTTVGHTQAVACIFTINL